MTLKTLVSDKLKGVYIKGIKLASTYHNKTNQVSKPDKIVYMMSFTSNDGGLIDRLGETFGKEQVIICYTESVAMEAEAFKRKGYDSYPLSQLSPLLTKTLKVLTEARWVLCDNYFPLLAGLTFHPDCKVIQLWHANGAVKKFGWQDSKTKGRSQADQKRFEKVYACFDYYLVASEAMVRVFKDSYHGQDHQFLRFGFHRSDVFFQQHQQKSDGQQSSESILYMPTYREDNQIICDTLSALNDYGQAVGIKIIFQLHPVTRKALGTSLSYPYLSEARDVGYPQLYSQASCLITDYSSVPFDYCLAKPSGRIIFYWPDFQGYDETTGINEEVKQRYGKEAVVNETGLITALQENDSVDLVEMNLQWNTYNKGNAQEQLLTFMSDRF